MMRRHSQNKAKDRVRLSFIYESYFKDYCDEHTLMADKTIINHEDVMKKVEGIPLSQAKRTIANSKELDAVKEAEYTAENARQDLDLVNERSIKIRDAVQNLMVKVAKYDSKDETELDHK